MLTIGGILERGTGDEGGRVRVGSRCPRTGAIVRGQRVVMPGRTQAQR